MDPDEPRRSRHVGEIPEPDHDAKAAHREHDATDVWEPR